MSGEVQTMLFIFFARVCDQSLDTIRIILIARGYRFVAPILGFFVVLIWLTAISKALQHMNNVYGYLIYAGGFATGNYIGMMLEKKIAIGYQSIRIITSKIVSALPLTLREEGFGVTEVEGQGLRGKVSVLYSLIPKKSVRRYLEIVNALEPEAFYSIEDVSSFHSGYVSGKPFADVIRAGFKIRK